MCADTANRDKIREKQNANLRQFKPGQSGNPNGRPRKLFTEAALKLGKTKHKEDKEKRTFAELAIRGMYNEAIKGNVAAWVALADRLEGKPLQGMELSGPGGNPLQIENIGNPVENEKRIAELLAKSGAKKKAEE